MSAWPTSTPCAPVRQVARHVCTQAWPFRVSPSPRWTVLSPRMESEFVARFEQRSRGGFAHGPWGEFRSCGRSDLPRAGRVGLRRSFPLLEREGASCLMRHASCVTHHASRITHHASRIMQHASCLMPQASGPSAISVEVQGHRRPGWHTGRRRRRHL
jgi:hypothetical protein